MSKEEKAVKLTRRHIMVLSCLARQDGWTLARQLPDGNGRSGGATGVTLRELEKSGLVDYGKEPAHSLYGYRITSAGRAALEAKEGRE